MRKRAPETKIISCKECGKELEIPYFSKRYLCDDCKKKSQQNHFHNRKEQKILCKNPLCNNIVKIDIKKISTAKEFLRGETLCKECKQKSENNFIDREVRCSRCGGLIKLETLHNSYQLKPIRYEVCDSCKQAYEQEKIEKRKQEKIEKRKQEKQTREENRIKEQEVICKNCGKLIRKKETKTYFKNKYKYEICDSCRVLRKEELKEQYSKRMKENNPMYSIETRNKVGDTIKRKIENGELSYKQGVEHHLFKGLRPFNSDVRSHLYGIWILPILQRDNFKCTKCGSTKNLQVHHIVPLREICTNVFQDLEINIDNTLFTREDLGNDIYEKALTKVLESHKLDYGITLCKECHEKEDFYYRPYKGKKKYED